MLHKFFVPSIILKAYRYACSEGLRFLKARQ